MLQGTCAKDFLLETGVLRWHKAFKMDESMSMMNKEQGSHEVFELQTSWLKLNLFYD